MWIDDGGALWLPAAQLNRSKEMNGGVDAVARPSVTYRMNLGLRPARH